MNKDSEKEKEKEKKSEEQEKEPKNSPSNLDYEKEKEMKIEAERLKRIQETKPRSMPKGDYQVHVLLEEVRKIENKSQTYFDQ
jgi:hypothetical protein